jgi:hypothetical protein
MSKNISLLLFTTSVLLASFAVLIIPQASALNLNPVDNSHVTARFTSEHKICGAHLCILGEKTRWEQSVWGYPHMSQGKVPHPQQHGEDVMKKMSGAAPNPTSGMQMTTNGNNRVNMTENAPSGMK